MTQSAVGKKGSDWYIYPYFLAHGDLKNAKKKRKETLGFSAGIGKLCIFGHLRLVFNWSCFVSCLLLLLYYVICAPVLTEGAERF